MALVTNEFRQGLYNALATGVWRVRYARTLSFGVEKDLISPELYTMDCTEFNCVLTYKFYPISDYALTDVDLSGLIVNVRQVDGYIIVKQGVLTTIKVNVTLNVSGVRAYYLLDRILRVINGIYDPATLYVFNARLVYDTTTLTVKPSTTVSQDKLYITTVPPASGMLYKIEYLNSQNVKLFEANIGKQVSTKDIIRVVMSV